MLPNKLDDASKPLVSFFTKCAGGINLCLRSTFVVVERCTPFRVGPPLQLVVLQIIRDNQEFTLAYSVKHVGTT